MTFAELQKIFEEKLGIRHLADIARELDVTPQAVSNWKARNEVPYKYIKIVRQKLKSFDESNTLKNNNGLGLGKSIPFVNDLSENEESISELISKVIQLVLSNWKVFLYGTTFCLLVGAYILLTTDDIFMSSAKIIPGSGGDGAGSELRNLASNFGFNLSQGESSNISTAVMYPEIIKSRRLAKKLLFLKVDTEEFGPNIPLINIINKNNDIEYNWSDRKIRQSIRKLIKMYSSSKDRKKPMVTINAYSKYPDLSKEIVKGIISELQKMLNMFKVSKVKEKKNFIDKRISEVSIQLKNGEESLKSFREKNRDFIASPKLLLQEERLIRDVDVQTQLYISLKTQFEMAQIEEVHNNSIFQVLDLPQTPDKRISPRPKSILLFSVLAGLLLSFGYIYAFDWYKENKNIFHK
tara:strand:- start:3106 stop:4332 length:1227 start_codon:yes stop_codon:yes gene_type:complete